MNFKVKKITGLFLLISVFLSPGYSQVPFFQNYFLLKKNEPVYINSIFQDKAGFIWYGTDKGLFKFDGLNQKRFTATDGLPDNNVTAIAQDSAGRIWIGHKNGKLASIEKGIVRKFIPKEGDATQEISDILFDKHGNLWFSTLSDGLYYYTQDRLFRLDEQEGMPDLYIYDIAEDQSGNIWAGTDRGVAVCSLHERKVLVKTLNYHNGLPDNIIKKLAIDSSGKVWMGTEDAGIVLYNSSSGKCESVIKKGGIYGSVTDFVFKGNQVWIATQQTGLVIYDIKTEQVKIYNSKDGSGFMSISVLFKDYEGDIWAGAKSGILRTQGDYIEYIDAFEPAKDVNIIALAADKQGCIWFANSEGLFKRSVDKTGAVTVEKPLANTSFQRYNIISLYTDPAGYIWAGLYGEGVLRINSLTGKIRHINSELRNGSVLNITGKNNVVWLATLGGGAQINIRGEQLSIKNYGNNDGLVSDYIYQVFIDSKDRVWFATDRAGVDMLDKSGFHHFKEGLQSKVIYGFAEDGTHQIWANVQAEGLYKFNGVKFQPIGAKTRLREHNINCFSSDKSGNLVVMHDLGIDVYDVKKDKIRYLGEEAGIRDKLPNLNAVAKDTLGHIFIGTERGIIKYSDINGADITDPQPEIVGLKIFDRVVNLASDTSLSYNQNNITIYYHGFWYQNPAELTYRYKLENYDREWISSRDHSAIYSSLPPGEYTFRLEVSDTGDFKGAKESSFRFKIRPPFWRTIWFYILSTVTILFWVYGLVKFRERKLRYDKQILEKKVEERTREIQMKNDEIQSQNEEIQSQAEEINGINENLELLVKHRTTELEKKNKALEEYAFINAHNLRAPVASILGLINLIRNFELTSDEGKAVAEHLQESGKKLEATVRSITEAIERGD